MVDHIHRDGAGEASGVLVSLWRHTDFAWLWSANAVAQLGGRVGQVVIPLTAITYAGATPLQMGLLAAAGTVGPLLFGLPAGAWVDRMSRRRVLLATDFARALLLASIPLSVLAGILAAEQLLVIALLISIATIFFDVAHLAFIPTLLSRDRLVEANAKLQGSYSVAAVIGPGLGGLITTLAGPANAIWTTALTFLASTLMLRRVRTKDRAPVSRTSNTTLADVAAGLRYVLRDGSLRAIAFCTGTANLFATMISAMLILFLTHDLRLSPAVTGLVMACSGVGGVAGTLTARRWDRVLGQERVIVLSLLVTQPFGLLIVLARPGIGMVLAGCGWFVMGCGSVLYNVAQVSYRQGICPGHLLGRVQASQRFLAFALAPLGGILGGAVATWLDIRAALLVGILGMILTTLWLICSPLRQSFARRRPAQHERS